MKPRIIAFYLPQFHPTKNNNKWWGQGFTEWTNVGKAKPLFKGHEQPKVPADLGYYDLRLSQPKIEQAILAKEAGIEGFCYYHYWFGRGHEELDLPFKEIVKTRNPDFPFCLCWANESWNKKFWNKDGTYDREVLAEQLYDNEVGHREHFYSLLDAFRDERYIKINGKILFMIYKPLDFNGVRYFIELWNKLALENGLKGFHFVGQTINEEDIDKILSLGFDSVNIVRLWDAFRNQYRKNSFKGVIRYCHKYLLNNPFIVEYKKAVEYLIKKEDSNPCIYPTLIPNWDHTPRSGTGGSVLINSSPTLFKQHAKDVFSIVKDKPYDQNLVFLKSWNEWGEGNYMEPDLKNGKGYINALREALEEIE